jgi:hypothetical protein
VVGEPGQRHSVANGVREPARERRPVGLEEREVVQARVAVGRLRGRLLDEAKERRRVGAEQGAARALLEHVESDDLAVVVERPLEVGHREVHRAHPRLGGKRHASAR